MYTDQDTALYRNRSYTTLHTLYTLHTTALHQKSPLVLSRVWVQFMS